METTPETAPETAPRADGCCTRCGASLPAGASFCPRCGHSVTGARSVDSVNRIAVKVRTWPIVLLLFLLLAAEGCRLLELPVKAALLQLPQISRLLQPEAAPEARISEFMACWDHDAAAADWQAAFGLGSVSVDSNVFLPGKYTYTSRWSFTELVPGIPGELVWYSSPNDFYWKWTVRGEDADYSRIEAALTAIGSQSMAVSSQDDSFTRGTAVRWIPCKAGSYSPDWVPEGTDVNDWEADRYHAIFLLQKGGTISVQYIPGNVYGQSQYRYLKLN